MGCLSMINRLKNKVGFTLFEMTVSILVGSIVMVTLMSVLTMTVRAKMQFDYESRMINESYLISEQLKSAFANALQKEFTVLVDDEVTGDFELQIDYCDVIAGVLECSKTDPNDGFEPYFIVYDSTQNILTFDNQRLHSGNIFLVEGTSFDFTWNGNPTVLDTRYPTGELHMKMMIQIQTTSGGLLDSKEYNTMLMFSNYN